MIISRTPFRISFVGGGSDTASFYKTTPGAVISTTINKYIYIAVNKRFDGRIHLSYSETEITDKVSDLKHLIARETLQFFKIRSGIEIFSIGDIPAGTGLGSSGAYTVGLIHAISAHKGIKLTAEQLGHHASIVEIEKANRPIGKQDQYASAYGNLNYIQFNSDQSVVVESIKLSSAKRKQLEENFLLFYTGTREFAEKILAKQNEEIEKLVDKRNVMLQMVGIAKALKEKLNKGNIDDFGELLHENWLLKKKLTGGVSNPGIDEWYETALKKGATGGKICGAGGRGFLLLYASPQYHRRICSALSHLQRVDFSFEEKGSTIIYQ